MRQDIAFKTEDGLTLRGWFYRAEGASGAGATPRPTVVMAHGFSGVKELMLPQFAEVFVAAGLNCLVYDHRNFGDSEGEPRQEIDPWAQMRGYQDAISFARSLPEVDGARIGVWGSSYSGGHVLMLGAIDRRVKCVVSQVPLVNGRANIRWLVRADRLRQMYEDFAADREARWRGEPARMIPVTGEDGALPTAETTKFLRGSQNVAPNWRDEVTLRSVEYLAQYDPSAYVADISPTPLLMIVARQDTLTCADESLRAYQRALPPKRLCLLEGGHFDAYGEEFEVASGAARDWFVAHLVEA